MEKQMNTRMRLAASAAMTAAIAGLLGASAAAPASAATGATARLQNGVLTITGTAARDVLGISMGHRQLAIDFGFDGTVDARFLMSRIQRVSVQLGDGNDGISVIGAGVGDVPITMSGGPGNDALNGGAGTDFLAPGPGNNRLTDTRGDRCTSGNPKPPVPGGRLNTRPFVACPTAAGRRSALLP